MMSLNSFKRTSTFKSDLKTYKHNKRVLSELETVIKMVMNGITLPRKYNLHELKGRYKGEFDCHLFPNVILIYHIENNILVLTRIGSHNKLELTESISGIPAKISNTTIKHNPQIKSEIYYFGTPPKKPDTLRNYLKTKRKQQNKKIK